ncbi:MAG: NAD(P) transhydrogenase subunit alpha [Planctomycetes bacterium]|nr:NAD(P) transhydrogenase subunit alpha [Planctomycetota bacterium]
MSVTAAIIIFVLALLVGLEVAARVPARLHTPLLSGSSAISGTILVGAIAIAAAGDSWGATAGLAAVTAATANVVGGLLVTDRMLRMFDRRKGDRP